MDVSFNYFELWRMFFFLMIQGPPNARASCNNGTAQSCIGIILDIDDGPLNISDTIAYGDTMVMSTTDSVLTNVTTRANATGYDLTTPWPTTEKPHESPNPHNKGGTSVRDILLAVLLPTGVILCLFVICLACTKISHDCELNNPLDKCLDFDAPYYDAQYHAPGQQDNPGVIPVRFV